MRTLLLIAMLGTANAAAAADFDGADLFGHYCASCHGLGADGRGPMAPVLVVQPADLTALSTGNGGIFPTARVIARIDGRDPLVAHGSAMPVFGPFFEGRGAEVTDENGATIDTSAPIEALVNYLKNIQK